ncbi:Por secretion system C-terminal sorting domain-containing protein [Dyadobacter koreensis]|uniref:Por secretion system C-terminal sorting domain-containing protein n=1 Tax=Dyadobacter koreensis TaxID=408657 RepID=A0A1H6YWJ9_9BACT|nr:T9SS type A sorting domain-containing protein [Dyadobacter koreensis]SEJ43417.1 Por secretion system C-terminal sorting domain-containing protein [Dyadobacter koreensis]
MKNLLLLLKKNLPILFILLNVQSLNAQNWGEVIKMVASDRADKITSGRTVIDEFGNSVAISGDYAVVGAHFSDRDSTGENYVRDAGAAFIFHKVGDTWQKIKKLSPGNRVFDSFFGSSVAINGDYIVVGAHGETEGPFNGSGAVYIFEKNSGGYENWGEVERLVAPGRHEGYGDGFGISVSISSDYLLIGAPGENYDGQDLNPLNDSGAAYVFKRNVGGYNNWGFLKKITAPNRPEQASFGYSVSISNDYFIVGAPSENIGSGGNMSQAGACYIFNRNLGGEDNWGVLKKLEPTTRVPGASFGFSVSMDGNFAIVGAYKENIYNSTGALLMAGAAYIFERNWGATNNWGQVRRLGPEYPEYNEFGRFVSINGQTAVVGAFYEELDNSSPKAGSAFIFEKDLYSYNNWGILKKITNPVRRSDDKFGSAVAVDGENIIVGAIGESRDSEDTFFVKSAGAAHFFSKNHGGVNNWGHIQKITASTGARASKYGSSVSVSGSFAIVGAVGESKDSTGQFIKDYAGAAYILYDDFGNWRQVKKIVAPDRQSVDNFGAAVSISGNYAVVSSIWQNNGEGAVYIFKKDQGGLDNWGFVKKVVASVPTRDDWFGYSVGISGDNLVVGSFGDDEDAQEGSILNAAGSAYLFNKNQGGADQWGLVKKLTASRRTANDIFGSVVSISGDYVIVSSLSNNTDESESNPVEGAGAAYIFKRDLGGVNNWGELKKLVGTQRAPFDRYGRGLSIERDYIIVGSSGTTPDYNAAVYIYSKNTGGEDNWGLEKKIAGGGQRFDKVRQQTVTENFGGSVAIGNGFAVISSNTFIPDYANNSNLPVSNDSYVLKQNQGGAKNWGTVQMIGFYNANYGVQTLPVSMSNRHIVMGANMDSTDGFGDNTIPNAGAVHIFKNFENPLPVTLTMFEATKSENSVLLNWSTTFETNSDFFEIQRSRDGRNWSMIGTIFASHESDKTKTYSFADKNPFYGENLYRLKMVDQDGTFTYSRIRSLTFGSESQIAVYPNPVQERLFVKLKSGEIDFITVTNSTGQVVSKYNKMPDEGINLDHLTIGNYIINVIKTDGTVSSKKVAVAR